MDRYLGRHRCFSNCLASSAFITAHKLKPPVNYHLRRIDAAQAKLRCVGALPFTVFVRRVGIPPSNVIPVVYVLAQNDQFRTAYWLRSIEPLQQGIGRWTAGTPLGGKQFDQNRYASTDVAR